MRELQLQVLFRFLVPIAFIGALLLGYMGWDTLNRYFNYHRVPATVTAIRPLCFMEKREYRKTTISDEGPCPMMESAVAAHPRWEGFSIVRVVHLDYVYTEQDRVFTGEAKRIHADTSGWSAGMKIEILVRNNDPKVSYWRN